MCQSGHDRHDAQFAPLWVRRSLLAHTIRSDPLPSCLCFELLAVTDSLAIRVATVPISIPFSVQSKISERFQVL